jgi:hypothetical protein
MRVLSFLLLLVGAAAFGKAIKQKKEHLDDDVSV